MLLIALLAGWLVIGYSVMWRLAVRTARRFSQRYPRLPAETPRMEFLDYLFIPLWPIAIGADWWWWRGKVDQNGDAFPKDGLTRQYR